MTPLGDVAGERYELRAELERYRAVAQLASRGQGQVYSARFVASGQVITTCGDGQLGVAVGEEMELGPTATGQARGVGVPTSDWAIGGVLGLRERELAF